jgi:transcriptional regulator with XRE-family HTH domain
MGELSIAQKKEYAKVLFTREDMTQKEIAQKVGVSEKTMSKWANEDNWEVLRASLFISKEDQIVRTYRMIDKLMSDIEEKRNGIPDTKEADVLAKLAATIRSLETEIDIAQIVDVFKEFIGFIKVQDFKKAQEIIVLLDGFIKYKLKAA